MTMLRIKYALIALLCATAAFSGVYCLRQRKPIEFQISPHIVTWKQWASPAKSTPNLDSIDLAQLDPSPLGLLLPAPTTSLLSHRVHVTFSPTVDFLRYYQTLAYFASHGLTSLRWRIQDADELIYTFPPYEADDWLLESEPTSEDLRLVARTGNKLCLVKISLTPSGISLHDVPRTIDELQADIATAVGPEAISQRCVIILASPETPLKVAKPLFAWITAEAWRYQVIVMDPIR